MKIAVAAETDAGEPRVAATPETVKKMMGLGAEVVGCAFLIELSFLGGRARLDPFEVHALLDYQSE